MENLNVVAISEATRKQVELINLLENFYGNEVKKLNMFNIIDENTMIEEICEDPTKQYQLPKEFANSLLTADELRALYNITYACRRILGEQLKNNIEMNNIIKEL